MVVQKEWWEVNYPVLRNYFPVIHFKVLVGVMLMLLVLLVPDEAYTVSAQMLPQVPRLWLSSWAALMAGKVRAALPLQHPPHPFPHLYLASPL